MASSKRENLFIIVSSPVLQEHKKNKNNVKNKYLTYLGVRKGNIVSVGYISPVLKKRKEPEYKSTPGAIRNLTDQQRRHSQAGNRDMVSQRCITPTRPPTMQERASDSETESPTPTRMEAHPHFLLITILYVCSLCMSIASQLL